MTAPSGQSPDRFRFGQPVVATSDHTALTTNGTPLQSLSGDVGQVTYFWNDGRYCVEWDRHPGSTCVYGVDSWPSQVGPAPADPGDTRPVAPDARMGAWAEAIARHFGSS